MKSLRSPLALLGVLALVGCDVPTDAPMVEQRWIVPMDNTTIAVDNLLPDGVGVLGEFFGITVAPFSAQSTLGELCASCADGPGPLPAFTGTFTASAPYPSGVAGATLETGSVVVAIQNGLSFDPTEGGGSVVVTLTDGPGGKVLGQATISSGFVPGGTAVRGITLAGGSVEPSLTASAVVTSPGGQAATVSTSGALTLNVEPILIQASFVTVSVAGRPVELRRAELNVADLDASILDRIQSGGLKLDIANSFGVPMTLDVVIEYPGGSLSKTVAIEGAAVSSVTVPYSGDDFRSFLGKEGAALTGTGVVSSAAGSKTLRAEQRLEMRATLDLTIIVG